MCISTDDPHFDSDFPYVSTNLRKNVSREIAAQVFMGGAHLYGFTEAHFVRGRGGPAQRQRPSPESVNVAPATGRNRHS